MVAARRPLVLDEIAHVIVDAGREKPLLAPLSRAFAPGRFHVVGGPSGAGKTALLSILSLAVRPSRGAILWGNDNLSRFTIAEQVRWRRQNLSLIVRTSRLVGVMTVREHVQLVSAIRDKPEAEAEGLAILGMLGMGTRLSHVPAQLSGGEKQRVAIAQALCAKPAILLADEPTAALDHSTAALVAQTLRGFARDYGAVVICVSHDRAVMDAADELMMLEKV